MRLVSKLILSTMLSVAANSSLAWVSVENSKVVEFVQFNAGIGRDYSLVKFKQVDGVAIFCHVAYEEAPLTSLVLALYMSGKESTVHCYDEVVDIGGFKTHRLHRVVATP